MNPTIRHHSVGRPDPLEMIADQVSSRFKVSQGELLRELHRLVDGPASRTMRVLLISHLVEEEARDVAGASQTAQVVEARMLTTVEAAELLGCSRPHVVMLIDGGKLPGATRTDGGHRRVPEAAVLALKKARDVAKGGDTEYRAAGQAAGIYDIPEKKWVEASQRGR